MILITNECLNIVITILLTYLFFTKEFSNSKHRYFLCFFSSILLLIFLYFFPSDGTLAIVDLIINLLIIIFLLNSLWYQKLASFLLVYTFGSFVYQSITLIINILFRFSIFFGMNNDIEEIFYKMITNIILIIILFIKRKKEFYFYLSFTNQLFLSLFSSVVVFLVSFLRLNQNIVTSKFLNIIILICVTTIFSISFYLFSASQKNYYAKQNQLQSQYIHTLKTYYSALETNEREIRKIKHDMKNHIRILNHLINSEKYKESQAYIQQIDEFTTSKISSIPNVGNVLINAILLQKSTEFPDITIEVKGSANKTLLINDYDLCTIISNLLDNALEYSVNNDFFKVEFYIHQENSVLSIRIANETMTEINIEQLQEYSSKFSKEHGYGINNVKEAVNRNHGILRYEQTEKKLFVTVQLFSSN